MTLYRRKLETVEAFHYEAALETMDFKYPFPRLVERYGYSQRECYSSSWYWFRLSPRKTRAVGC